MFVTFRAVVILAVSAALFPFLSGASGAPSMSVRLSRETSGTVEVFFDGEKLELGQQREFKFEVENKGNQPLEIKLSKKPCGCLSVGTLPTIQPGEKQPIVMRYLPGASEKPGEVRVSATFETNDPKRPTLIAHLRGYYNPAIRLSPNANVVDFGEFKNPAYVLAVYSTSWTDFELNATIKEAKGEPVAFDLKIEKLKAKDLVDDVKVASGYVLTITAVKNLPRGFIHRELMLNIIRKEETRTLVLPVYGDSTHNLFKVKPEKKRVDIEQASLLKGAEVSFFLTFPKPQEVGAVKITRVEPGCLQADLTRIGDGKDWRVKIKIPPDHPDVRVFEAEGEMSGRILLAVPGSDNDIGLELSWLKPKDNKK